MRTTTRITAFVGEEVAKNFTELTRQIGISGRALLSRTLPAELNHLAELPGNTGEGARVLRLMAAMGLGKGGARGARLNFTLDRQDAQRMKQLCREKAAPRDLFIHHYIHFLVNGDDGCEAPLVKISKILANPRYEYEQNRWLSPQDDREVICRKAVSQDNPYSSLHLDDESLELTKRVLEQLRKDRTPETR